MEVENRLIRAIIGGLGLAFVAILVVATIKLLFFLLDAPGWWILVGGLFFGGFGAQWLIDRPRGEAAVVNDQTE